MHSEVRQQPTLISLPAELLHRIFEYLATNDIIAARQTCKILGTVGGEHLLDTVHLFYEHSSFEELRAISSHPLIGPRIRTLCIYGDRVRYHTRDDWIRMRDYGLRARRDDVAAKRLLRFLRPHLQRTEQMLTEQLQRLELEYEAYNALYERQLALTAADEDLKSLISLFQACRRIDTVRLSYEDMQHSLQSDNSYYRVFPEPSARPEGYPDRCVAGQRDLRILCLALQNSNTKLHRLEAMNFGCAGFTAPDRDLALLHSTLSQLRLLQLSFTVRHPPEGFHPGVTWSRDIDCAWINLRRGELKGLLASMTQLKTLRLGFPVLEMEATGTLNVVADLENAVGLITWPKLRDIALTGMTASRETLVNFLLRHKGRLRRLELAHLTLIRIDETQEWPTVFSGVAGQVPRLQQVILNGQFDLSFTGSRETQQDFFIDGNCSLGKLEKDFLSRLRGYLRTGGCPPPWQALRDPALMHSDGDEYFDELPPDTVNMDEQKGVYDSDESLIDLDDESY